jgi:hypothetical protein
VVVAADTGNPAALTLDSPLDLDDARIACRRLAELRREAEDTHERLTDEAAVAERDYRKAFALALVQTTGPMVVREAVARAEVSDLSYARDLSAGLVRVQLERLRGLEGQRSQLRALMEMSMRARIDERDVVLR